MRLAYGSSMSLIWSISRRDIGMMPISINWCRDVFLQLIEISKMQSDTALVASFRLLGKIFFAILLNLSIKLLNCNNYTRPSIKIFSKRIVRSIKRGFELSLLPGAKA